jgi:hypothetical protein
MASPAVFKCSLPRKAALRSGAAMAAMMPAHVFCGRVCQAFLAILGPERKRWEDSGVSQVTRNGLNGLFMASISYSNRRFKDEKFEWLSRDLVECGWRYTYKFSARYQNREEHLPLAYTPPHLGVSLLCLLRIRLFAMGRGGGYAPKCT